jgi:Spy/CpxP family protein refolding chaperone
MIKSEKWLKSQWRGVLAAVVLLALGALAVHVTTAAPPPPRAERVEDAIADLNLTPDQQQKADSMLQDLHDKERQAREDFLKQMSAILTPEQLRQLRQKMDRPANGPPRGAATREVDSDANAPKGTVIFHGGYETDPRDHGRPVVLVAAALNVPTDLFRDAFSGVTPAAAGEQPQDHQVRLNKQALLKVLGPHGVTNDQLDTVSNYYRYNQSKGEMWKHRAATATAIITHGVVTGFKITDAGAGYSSPPTIDVAGYDVHAVVTLSFGGDLATNGSIQSIAIDKPQAH